MSPQRITSNTALGLIALTIASQLHATPPPGEAFRGISWGASEVQIRRTFAQPLQTDSCETEKESTVAGWANQVCDHPYVEPYEVAGIPFKLSFNLDAKSRRLKDVVLFHSVTIDGADPQQQRMIFSARYSSLEESLTARYGDTRAPVRMEDKSRIIVVRTWETPSSTIELSMSHAVSKQGSIWEKYQVWYKPRGRDANKL